MSERELALWNHILLEIGLDAEQARTYEWFHASDRQLPYVVERAGERGRVTETFRLAPARILSFDGARYAVSWNDRARCVVYWTYEDVVRGLARSIRESLPARRMTSVEADALAGLYDLDHEGNPEPVE